MSDAGTFFALILAIAGGSTLLTSDLHVVSEPTAPRSFMVDTTLVPELGQDGRLYLEGDINGHAVRFMLDTAANRTLISEADARMLGVRITGRTEVRTVGGLVQAYEGRATSVRIGSTVLPGEANILIVRDLPHSLLGMDLIKALGSTSIAL